MGFLQDIQQKISMMDHKSILTYIQDKQIQQQLNQLFFGEFIVMVNITEIKIIFQYQSDILKAIIIQGQDNMIRPLGMFLLLVGIKLNKISNQSILQIVQYLLKTKQFTGFLTVILDFLQKSAIDSGNVNQIMNAYQQIFNMCLRNYTVNAFASSVYKQFKELYSYYSGIFNNAIEEYGLAQYINQSLTYQQYILYAEQLGTTKQYVQLSDIPEDYKIRYALVLIKERKLHTLPTDDQQILLNILKKKQINNLSMLEHALYLFEIDLTLLPEDYKFPTQVENINYCLTQFISLQQLSQHKNQLFEILIQCDKLRQIQFQNNNDKQLESIVRLIKRFLQLWMQWDQFQVPLYDHPFGKIINYLISCIQGEQKIFTMEPKHVSCQINYIGYNLIQYNKLDPLYLWCVKVYKFSEEQHRINIKNLNSSYIQQFLVYILSSESQSLLNAFKYSHFNFTSLHEILDIVSGIAYLKGDLSNQFIQCLYSVHSSKQSQSIKSLPYALSLILFSSSKKHYQTQNQIMQDINTNIWQLITTDKQLTQSQIAEEMFQKQKTQQQQFYILQLVIIYLHTLSQDPKFNFQTIHFQSIYKHLSFSQSNVVDLEREMIQIILKTNAQIKYMISQPNMSARQKQNIKYFLLWNVNMNEENTKQIYITIQDIFERIILSCTYLFIIKQIQNDDKTKNYQMQILNQIIAYLILQQHISHTTQNIVQILKYISFFDNVQLIQDYIQYTLYRVQVTEDAGMYTLVNQDENITDVHDINKFSVQFINVEFSQNLQSPNNLEQVMQYLSSAVENVSNDYVQLVILMLVDYVNIQYSLDAMQLLRFIYNTENIFVKNDLNNRFMKVKILIVESIQKYQYNDYQINQIQKFLELDHKIITTLETPEQYLRQSGKNNLFLDTVVTYLEENKYQSMYCFTSLHIIARYLNSIQNKNMLVNIISKNNVDKIKYYDNLGLTQMQTEKVKVITSIAQLQYFMLYDIMALRGVKERCPVIMQIIQLIPEHLYRDFNLSEIFISNIINQTRDQQIIAYFSKLIKHILSLKYPQYIEVEENTKMSFEIQAFNEEYMIMLFNFIDRSNFLQVEKILDLKTAIRYDPRNAEEQLKENGFYTWFLFAYSARQYQIANQIIEQIYQLYVKLMEETQKFNDQLLNVFEQNIYDSQVKAYNIDSQESRINDLLNMMAGIKLNIINITPKQIQNHNWLSQNVTQKVVSQIEMCFSTPEINYLLLQALLANYPSYFYKFITSEDRDQSSQNYYSILDTFIQNNSTNMQFSLNQLQNILEKIIMEVDVHQLQNKELIIDLIEQFFIFNVNLFKNKAAIEIRSIEYIIYAWRLCTELFNKLGGSQNQTDKTLVQRLKILEYYVVLNSEDKGPQIEYVSEAKRMITSLNIFQMLHIIGPIYSQYVSIQKVIKNDKYANQRLIIVDIILKTLQLKPHLDYYLRQQAFYYTQDQSSQAAQKKSIILAQNAFNNANAFLNQLIQIQIQNFFSKSTKTDDYTQLEKAKMQLYFEEYKTYSVQFTIVAESLVEKKRDANISYNLFCLPCNDFINITHQPDLTIEKYLQQVQLYHIKTITFIKIFTSVDMPILYKTDKQLQFIVKRNAHSDQQVTQYYQFLNTLQLDYVTKYKLRPYAVSFLSYIRSQTNPYYFIEFIRNVKDLKQGQQRTEFRSIPKQDPSPKFAQYLYNYKMQQMLKTQARHFSFNPSKLRDQYFERIKIIDSIAFCVVICFILRIGDRHTSNIVQDINTKELHYIDFDCVFGKGYKLPVTEMVTARLTPQVMNMLEVKQLETRVRQVSQQLLNKIVSHLSVYISIFSRCGGSNKYSNYQVQVYMKVLDILHSQNYMRAFEQFLDFQRDPFKLAYMYEGWNGLDDPHYKDYFSQRLK